MVKQPVITFAKEKVLSYCLSAVHLLIEFHQALFFALIVIVSQLVNNQQ